MTGHLLAAILTSALCSRKAAQAVHLCTGGGKVLQCAVKGTAIFRLRLIETPRHQVDGPGYLITAAIATVSGVRARAESDIRAAIPEGEPLREEPYRADTGGWRIVFLQPLLGRGVVSFEQTRCVPEMQPRGCVYAGQVAMYGSQRVTFWPSIYAVPTRSDDPAYDRRLTLTVQRRTASIVLMKDSLGREYGAFVDESKVLWHNASYNCRIEGPLVRCAVPYL